MQETPVAVTAVSGELLDQLNAQDVTRLGQLAPNLTIVQQTSSLNAASIFIRGIGQNEPAATAEAGVGIYLDGVYVARTAGAIFDLVDVERVEVLRGPQGTLFGRNTTGGAVQLVTRQLQDDFGVTAKAGYGSYDDWYLRTRVDTGWLGDSPLKATVAWLHRERDGYFDNTLAPDSRDPGSLDNDSFWVGVHGDFGDRLSVDLTADYGERRGTPVFFQTVAATPDVINYYSQSPLFGGAPYVVTGRRLDEGQQAPFDGRWHSKGEVFGSALTLSYSLGDHLTLKSISAYRGFNQDTICNLTGNGVMRGVLLDPATFAFAGVQDLHGGFNCHNAPQEQDQYSQELQLIGSTERWSYTAGVFYFEEKAEETNDQRFTFVLPGGQVALDLAVPQAFGGRTVSKAAFGQVSYTPPVLGDRIELTAGLRYTKDDKKFFSSTIGGEGDRSFSNTSWLVSANYRFTDDVMGYARVSTGYKAGGFSPRAARISSFDPEKATAYEVGLKAEWLGRRIRSNLALFRTDYSDLQISQFAAGSGGASAIIVNAGKATYRGVELEVVALVTDHLTVSASGGYTDPEYDEYLYRDPLTDVIRDVASEARFQYVVKSNWRVSAEYVFPPLASGRLSARIDYTERGQMYKHSLDLEARFNEAVRDPGQRNLSARIALSDIRLGRTGTWEVGVWGENLTDHANVGDGIDFGALGWGGKYWLEPRRYGVDVKLSF